MIEIDENAAERMWRDYCGAHPEVADQATPAAEYFGDSAELAEELLAFITYDPKRATAGLVADHVAESEPLPRIGSHWIACDGNGIPRVVLRIILDEAGTPITVEGLARETGVSRSWLYSQHHIRAEIGALHTRRQPSSSIPLTPQRQRATEASLLRRLEAATGRMRQLEEDNRQLRQALAEDLGTARTDRVTGKTSRRDTPEQRAAKLTGPG